MKRNPIDRKVSEQARGEADSNRSTVESPRRGHAFVSIFNSLGTQVVPASHFGHSSSARNARLRRETLCHDEEPVDARAPQSGSGG